MCIQHDIHISYIEFNDAFDARGVCTARHGAPYAPNKKPRRARGGGVLCTLCTAQPHGACMTTAAPHRLSGYMRSLYVFQ
jgi:hypothetical protein